MDGQKPLKNFRTIFHPTFEHINYLSKKQRWANFLLYKFIAPCPPAYSYVKYDDIEMNICLQSNVVKWARAGKSRAKISLLGFISSREYQPNNNTIRLTGKPLSVLIIILDVFLSEGFLQVCHFRKNSMTAYD